MRLLAALEEEEGGTRISRSKIYCRDIYYSATVLQELSPVGP